MGENINDIAMGAQRVMTNLLYFRKAGTAHRYYLTSGPGTVIDCATPYLWRIYTHNYPSQFTQKAHSVHCSRRKEGGGGRLGMYLSFFFFLFFFFACTCPAFSKSHWRVGGGGRGGRNLCRCLVVFIELFNLSTYMMSSTLDDTSQAPQGCHRNYRHHRQVCPHQSWALAVILNVLGIEKDSIFAFSIKWFVWGKVNLRYAWPRKCLFL